MSYGRVDRGGGREGNKKSLRKNKVTIADKLKHQHVQVAVERPTKSLPRMPSSCCSCRGGLAMLFSVH
jgi:hypothetical protein